MKTNDFYFELPEELVAQFPPENRGESRLLVLDRVTGRRNHTMVRELASLVEPGTLMVFNDSKVRKARIYGDAIDTSGRVEFLLLADKGSGIWEVSCTKMKKQRPGRRYRFDGGAEGEIIAPDAISLALDEGTRLLQFSPPIDDIWLEAHGHIPLPPYIRREDSPSDSSRYQTMFARELGSAAAPTAGLHFTPELLDDLHERGVETTTLTLHVSLGTFLPVRVEELEDHVMHEECWSISPETAAMINLAKGEGRPVLAVGTTSVRTLESAWETADSLHPAGLRSGEGRTRIFIRPGYGWKVVDGLFTNFHTPKSTLLMLVSAFAGREATLAAYAEAIEERYRFFSYGDAMLIL
ncbi:MAG: tRNA preQ1(34) S-adenosylmethionine ribosyltransferase-isomerase QueA [Spirochaetota bacterium]